MPFAVGTAARPGGAIRCGVCSLRFAGNHFDQGEAKNSNPHFSVPPFFCHPSGVLQCPSPPRRQRSQGCATWPQVCSLRFARKPLRPTRGKGFESQSFCPPFFCHPSGAPQCPSPPRRKCSQGAQFGAEFVHFVLAETTSTTGRQKIRIPIFLSSNFFVIRQDPAMPFAAEAAALPGGARLKDKFVHFVLPKSVSQPSTIDPQLRRFPNPKSAVRNPK